MHITQRLRFETETAGAAHDEDILSKTAQMCRVFHSGLHRVVIYCERKSLLKGESLISAGEFWNTVLGYVLLAILGPIFRLYFVQQAKAHWRLIRAEWARYSAVRARMAAAAATDIASAMQPIEKYPDVTAVQLHPDYFSRRLASRSSLLGLPREIKNTIYRLVLVHADDPIFIESASSTTKPPGEPGILRTCRTIRSETLRIYYMENSFLMRADDMEPDLVLAFHRISVQHSVELDVVVLPHGLRRWCNLRRWLHEFHHSRAYGLGISVEYNRHFEDTESQIIESMFRIAKTLQALPWSTTDSVLGDLRATLVSEHSGWGDD